MSNKRTMKKYGGGAGGAAAAQKYFAPIFLAYFSGKVSDAASTAAPNYEKSDDILYGNNYEWIPETIRHHIEKMMDKTYIWKIDIADRKITVNICVPAGAGAAPLKEFKKIYKWLCVASKYAPPAIKCSQVLNIYLYFTNLKKTLPSTRGKPILPENVNTAYTTSCVCSGGGVARTPPAAEIHLFRREEWFKVLIHESFHVLGLDFSKNYESSAIVAERYLGMPATRNCEWLIFETYTEIMAEMLALGFSRGGNLRPIDIKNEQNFTAAQCKKLLDYMELTYDDIWAGRGSGKWREKTPVFCYYVLKLVVWMHLPEFFKWCKNNNINILRVSLENSPEISFAKFLRKKAAETHIDFFDFPQKMDDNLRMMYKGCE